MRKYISEILEELGYVEPFAERVLYLQGWANTALRNTLKYAFDKNLKPDVTEIPEYKEDDSPIDLSYNNIYTIHKQYYLFFDNNLRDNVRNKRLRGLLETTSEDEAEVLKQVVLQNLNYKHLTEKLVRKAFPNLLTEKSDGPESEPEPN
tara:strand:- start:763 stop:1209 length:447 start_codon:yes stop_codon:yes gene_type:complete